MLSLFLSSLKGKLLDYRCAVASLLNAFLVTRVATRVDTSSTSLVDKFCNAMSNSAVMQTLEYYHYFKYLVNSL